MATKYINKHAGASEVFVFSSNEGGIHGLGSALEALQNWGAVLGYGVGIQEGW